MDLEEFCARSSAASSITPGQENNRGVRYAIFLTCLRFLCFGLAADKLEDSRAFSDHASGDA
jgi:hypothetical protein